MPANHDRRVPRKKWLDFGFHVFGRRQSVFRRRPNKEKAKTGSESRVLMNERDCTASLLRKLSWKRRERRARTESRTRARSILVATGLFIREDGSSA